MLIKCGAGEILVKLVTPHDRKHSFKFGKATVDRQWSLFSLCAQARWLPDITSSPLQAPFLASWIPASFSPASIFLLSANLCSAPCFEDGEERGSWQLYTLQLLCISFPTFLFLQNFLKKISYFLATSPLLSLRHLVLMTVMTSVTMASLAVVLLCTRPGA